MRLHPVKDGLIPMPDERGMTRRDSGGNKLVDVVSPDTGFCVGVRSALSITGRVVEAATIAGGSAKSGEDVRFDPESARHYELVRDAATDPIGFVVRLTTDGDSSLPCTRVRIIQDTKPLSGRSARKSTAPVRKPQSVQEQNDAAALAVLSAMGYSGEITREIRDAALAMIELEKNTISRLVRNKKEDQKLANAAIMREKKRLAGKSENTP